jgi:hypothetical protein
LNFPTKKPPLSPKNLHGIVENDRYPLSLRIRTPTAILAKLGRSRFASRCRCRAAASHRH